MRLQNLRYCNAYIGPNAVPNAFQRNAKLFLFAVFPWFRARFMQTDMMSDNATNFALLNRWSAPVDRVVKVARVLNMTAFFRYGRYASIVDRFLSLRLVYDDPE